MADTKSGEDDAPPATSSISAWTDALTAKLIQNAATAAVPFIGTFYLYYYEIAYCQYFGVPAGLIKISFVTGFLAILSLSAVIFVLGGVVAEAIERLSTLRVRHVSFLLMLSILFAGAGLQFFYNIPFDRALVLFEMQIAVTISLTISALFSVYDNDGRLRLANTLAPLVAAIGTRRSLVIALALLALPVCYIGGHYSAADTGAFYETVDAPHFLVVRVYNDTIIAVREAQVVRVPRLLCREFKVFSVDDAPALRLVYGLHRLSDDPRVCNY